MRLDKYLADMGIGTRSELKKGIRKGNVTVDGSIIKDPGFQVTDTMSVLYCGKPVQYETYSYYMLNKPAGVISATEDQTQKTVIDLITENKRSDLFPVGRLDKDTEGLLLITNDGPLAHKLLSPKHHVNKAYYARINGIVSNQDIKAFQDGLKVDESLTAMPADLTVLHADPDTHTCEVEITIQEGKFHQIKRMFQAIGMEVSYLKRIKFGNLILDPALSPGEYRRLTDNEINTLHTHNI
ncbi:MAG: rRNA pseudouridine synthase [Lachnospiraceae bacterium]|nr:rRNA pseudouridine synthase [Lachnospiraceae bacterium]